MLPCCFGNGVELVDEVGGWACVSYDVDWGTHEHVAEEGLGSSGRPCGMRSTGVLDCFC